MKKTLLALPTKLAARVDSTAKALVKQIAEADVRACLEGLTKVAVLPEGTRRIGRTSRTGLATTLRTLRMSYPHNMDHLEVLREKIGRLRMEIAQIQELNEQYRRYDTNETNAQVAHGQRHERLQAIQQELAQLAAFGRKEEMTEKHRYRLHLVKKVS